MRAHIEELITQALGYLKRDGVIEDDQAVDIQIEPTKDRKHGDYACNVAMMLAKSAGMNPRE